MQRAVLNSEYVQTYYNKITELAANTVEQILKQKTKATLALL